MPINEKSIFSILAQAGPVYGKNVKYLAVITLLAFVPVYVFRMFLPYEYFMAYNDFIDAFFLAAAYPGGFNFEILAASPALDGANMFVMMFHGIEFAFFPLSTAAAVYLAGRHIAGEKPGFDGMFSAALPRFPKMLITTAIVVVFYYIFLSFGPILMLLGLYFAVGMVFYQHVVTDLGHWGLGAISVSRFIIRGRWFKVLFGSLFVIILYIATSVILEIMVAALGVTGNPFIHLPLFLLQHFLLSFFAIAFALWYFDMKRVHRLRIEEIQRQMERLSIQMRNFGREHKGRDEMDDETRDDDEEN